MAERASAKIANLEAEVERLTRINRVLQAKVSAEEAEFLDDAPETFGSWAADLSAQEAAFVAILRRAHPKPASRLDILAHLPSQDHAVDRDVKLVGVLASRIRTKLGHDVIESVKGFGYGLTASGAQQVDAPKKDKPPQRDFGYSGPTSFHANRRPASW